MLAHRRRGIGDAEIDEDVADPAMERQLVKVGRIAAAVAIVIAMIAARPLLGKSDQAFQYIQEYTGFFTPGITVIFLLGLFWKRATEAGALVAAIGSFILSIVLKYGLPDLPFMDRMGVVFLATLAQAVIVSLARPQASEANRVVTGDVRYTTSTSFNVAAFGVVAILVALYATWW